MTDESYIHPKVSNMWFSANFHFWSAGGTTTVGLGTRKRLMGMGFEKGRKLKYQLGGFDCGTTIKVVIANTVHFLLCFCVCHVPVSYTHLTLPTNREV